MAKVHKPPDMTVQELAENLRPYGITLGQQLSDGTYRAYVRKDHRALFMSHICRPEINPVN